MNRDRVAVALMVLLLVGGAGLLWLWQSVRQAAVDPGAATQLQEFEVPQGASLRAVLQELESRQLIGNARHLEWYLRCCQRGKGLATQSIKAGRYRILPGQSPLAVLQLLIDGKVVLEKLTIVEGWSVAQMRAQLARTRGLKQTITYLGDAELMQQLGVPDLHPEGRFAPDTYAFSPGVTTDLQILRMALDAQQRILAEAWAARQPDLPVATPDEALVLASIVEKETGLASERGRVAGVFVNRLRKGMRLQSDPTVIYGIGSRYDGNIRKRDLTTDTPYNTYTRAGLPPTPIALPGRDAIVATLNPEKTDALFFVAIGDGSGGHYFSASVSEHNQAVQRYLERLRMRSLEQAAAEVLAEDAARAAAATPAAP